MCPCMAIYYCSPCVSVSVCSVYSFNQTATWPRFALAPFFLRCGSVAFGWS